MALPVVSNRRALPNDACRLLGLAALLIFASSAVQVSGQSIDVRAVGGALHVLAPAFDFIKGEALQRLKDGRSVRFDLALAVLPRPGAQATVQGRQRFVLSYDLWEERIAVTRTGTPPRSISHLTPDDAEAWCLEQLTVPVPALGRLGRDVPFWIRLEYRVEAENSGQNPDENAGFTLRGLIDTLSRRGKSNEQTSSIEAGPFRLSRN